MKTLVYAIATLACLTAASGLVTPSNAQVSVGLGNGGPTLRVGPEDREMHRDEDRGRHYGRRDRDDCREVTVRTRHPDGSVSVRTSHRCGR
jgi:hypothetical protein